MLNPKAKDLMSQGYARIGEISFKLTVNFVKGKDHTRSQKELWEQGIKTLRLLKVLFRHITFAEDGKPTLWRMTEEEANALLACLIKIAQLDQYPIAPSLLPSVKPKVINSGIQGTPGTPGTPGNDALINVTLENDEDQIKVRQDNVFGVKTFFLSLDLYVAQLLSVSGGILHEYGNDIDFTISITSTKGRDDIETLICTDPTIDLLLQPLVNLLSLNGITQPVVISLPIVDQAVNKTYTFESYDGATTKSSSTSISFVYPYLYGNNDAKDSYDYYANLTKIIAGKANRSVLFNGVDKYFIIGYPSSYGTLSSIKDGNGFEKITDFETFLEDVTSIGKDNNWTVEYRFYVTILKTSITNQNYTITHN
jgi:hypothetical protein